MTFDYLIQLFIFAYGFTFIHFALALLCTKKKHLMHWLALALLADFGMMCVAGGFSVHFRFHCLFANVAVFVPFVLIAPIGGSLAFECLSPRGLPPAFVKVSLAVSAATLATGFAFVAFDAFGNGWRAAYVLGYDWLFVNFLVIAVLEWVELRPMRDMPAALRFFYAILCLDVCLILGMALSRYLDYMSALYALWAVQIASLVAITIIAIRSPETFRLIQAAVRNVRYERSNLNRESIEENLRKLGELMNVERLFLNGDLTLEDLARRANLTPHQLSELINIYLGKNFAWYVNSFRIERAKELLIHDSGMSVIDVAFASGFNSKSSFNAAFRTHVGSTPTEYRQNVTA